MLLQVKLSYEKVNISEVNRTELTTANWCVSLFIVRKKHSTVTKWE